MSHCIVESVTFFFFLVKFTKLATRIYEHGDLNFITSMFPVG